jgi:hypothetical protein
MELIKPFIKYSKLYRHATDKRVKTLIYEKWHEEVKRSMSTLVNDTIGADVVMCIFCYKLNTVTDISDTEHCVSFCLHCFFPLLCNDEFITYCMLSVCYYESSCTAPSHRTVYRQRLKMTWYEHEQPGKMYDVVYRKCVQCNLYNENVGKSFSYFNELLFCYNCMFPLFIILIQNC